MSVATTRPLPPTRRTAYWLQAPGGDRAARDELLAALARDTGSALVHRIGNVAVLYRPREKLPRILIPDR